MEKQKLFIKLPNGRYQAYQEPEPPFDIVGLLFQYEKENK